MATSGKKIVQWQLIFCKVFVPLDHTLIINVKGLFPHCVKCIKLNNCPSRCDCSSVYYISVDSTCFGCWHPSSGARTPVITASGIDWLQWVKYAATNMFNMVFFHTQKKLCIWVNVSEKTAASTFQSEDRDIRFPPKAPVSTKLSQKTATMHIMSITHGNAFEFFLYSWVRASWSKNGLLSTKMRL
jgi:hypothetical protein